MHALWEHVHRLDPAEFVSACFAQDFKVPGEGGGVAGNVDDAGGGTGDEGLHEDELGWFVYRILKELENSKNDSLSYENLTAGERETILTWFQEEADFLTNDLKLTEDDITVIREKSLDKNGGFMTYENAEKALKPWISRWVSENR